MRDRQERERLEYEAAFRAAEAPLVQDLVRVGVAVESAWTLVNTAESYPEAISVLVAHLQRDYPDRVLEGIARALAVREARPVWHALAAVFRNWTDTTGLGAKAGLAAALSAAADDSVLEDLIELVLERRHGENRGLLLDALRRSKRPEAMSALENLRHDPELSREIAVILRRKLRSRRSPAS